MKKSLSHKRLNHFSFVNYIDKFKIVSMIVLSDRFCPLNRNNQSNFPQYLWMDVVVSNSFISFLQAYALSPAGPGYSGPGASPTQATGEPFAADSPYFPFSARPGSRLSPAKAKVVTPGLRPTKEEPQQANAALDNPQWVVSFA